MEEPDIFGRLYFVHIFEIIQLHSLLVTCAHKKDPFGRELITTRAQINVSFSFSNPGPPFLGAFLIHISINANKVAQFVGIALEHKLVFV